MSLLTALWLLLGTTAQGVAFPDEASPVANDSIYFLVKPEAMTSLDELLRPFRGRVVYLDLWASWCGPCRQEFAHASALQEFAAGKDLVLLYVSIDKPFMEAHWRAMVGRYLLRGYHVLAGPALVEDLRERFHSRDTGDGRQVLYIPRYVVIDRRGDIAVANARRPSKGKKLYRQLRQVLDR